MDYCHADVFSSQPLSGNGLTVIFHNENLDERYMQRLALEFKQFETVFLRQTGVKSFRARIFTLEEELDFAGHPILGAVSAIHEKMYSNEDHVTVAFELNKKNLISESMKAGGNYQASMNQGIPEFLGAVGDELKHVYLQALNLTAGDLYPGLPMEVVSTGLNYLLIPLASGLDRAKIVIDDFEAQLSKANAKFVYLFDIARMEGRTWDNSGAAEDVATGSAAGPVGAYLYKRDIRGATETIIINQGGFVGRPSKIKVCMDARTGEIHVAGDVRIIAKGELLL